VLRTLSVLCFVAIVAGLIGQSHSGALFGIDPINIAVQVAAVLLMIAARITSGRRSLQASANSTEEGLLTTGPYAYFRHPLYAALIHFTWAGALDHFSWSVLGWAELVTAGAFTRMHIEDYLLVRKYPEYREYKKRTKKLIPFVY
jgi:protein-S-isoprenylcysteine O-methyltransferase Ste14